LFLLAAHPTAGPLFFYPDEGSVAKQFGPDPNQCRCGLPLDRRRAVSNTHLNPHHRDTIEQIFSHPASSNTEWRRVLSLLETIGTVTKEHNGKLKITVGGETEVLRAPHGKDVDAQALVDLRRMLTQAGFAPTGVQETRDERSRDHGDGRWGEPT
jgi:hypothetical protein